MYLDLEWRHLFAQPFRFELKFNIHQKLHCVVQATRSMGFQKMSEDVSKFCHKMLSSSDNFNISFKTGILAFQFIESNFANIRVSE